MRTTLDLPDELFRQAKAAASLRGTSLRELVIGALSKELLHVSWPGPRTRVELPLVPGSDGTIKLTSDRVADVLEQEDLALIGR